MSIKNAKIYKFLGITAIIILLLFSVYEALKTNQNQQAQNNTQGNTINISTQNGPVQTKDFTKDPVLQVKDTVVIAKTANFDIVYFSKDQVFLITLESQPVREARNQAENEFLKDLNIGIGEACKLRVSLAVPFDVDNNLAGKDYGLSFCPTGIQFP